MWGGIRYKCRSDNAVIPVQSFEAEQISHEQAALVSMKRRKQTLRNERHVVPENRAQTQNSLNKQPISRLQSGLNFLLTGVDVRKQGFGTT